MTRVPHLFGLLLMACSSVSAVQAATVSITPTDQSVIGELGQAVEVRIDIAGLADLAAPSLSVFDITLNYDASLLNYGGAVFGDPLTGSQLDWGGGSFSQATPGSGSVNLLELSFESPATLDAQQSDAFSLAVLTFYTLDYGSSDFSFGTVVLGDALGDPIAFDSIGGNLTIAVVPVPAALWLFASALLVGLARARRRPGSPALQPS